MINTCPNNKNTRVHKAKTEINLPFFENIDFTSLTGPVKIPPIKLPGPILIILLMTEVIRYADIVQKTVPLASLPTRASVLSNVLLVPMANPPFGKTTKYVWTKNETNTITPKYNNFFGKFLKIPLTINTNS